MVFSVIQAFTEQNNISLTRSAHPTVKMDHFTGHYSFFSPKQHLKTKYTLGMIAWSFL